MVNPQSTVWTVFIAAFIIENMVFARATGVDGMIQHTRSTRLVLHYGVMMMAITVPATLLTWGVGRLFKTPSTWNTVRPMLAMLCLCLSFFIIHTFANRTNLGKKLSIPDDTLVLAAFSCSSLGTVLLSLSMKDLLNTMVYCVGCVLGLTGALLLVHTGRERLEISGVHRAFRGIPITLIYMGILSLAIYGLIGHQLPT